LRDAFPPSAQSPAALLHQAAEQLAAAQRTVEQPQQQLAPAQPQQEQQEQQPERRPVDHYRQAGQRLRSLLAGVGDGEDELLNSMLEEEPAASKLVLCTLAAAAISGGAALVCWVCGLDPLGGASLSPDTARAAAIGGAAAVPLVALKLLIWSEQARQQWDVLDDIHRKQVEAFKPLMCNLSSAQMLLLLATEVVPGMLILLPATTGGITKALEMYSGMAQVTLPEFLPGVLALCITALIAGAGKVAETSVSIEEYEVVEEALENADRFYRLTAVGPNSSPAEAQRAAEAFRSVALLWLARNQVATRAAGILGAAEIFYLGVLWQCTGDLAAPMVAALGSAAVDFANIRRLSVPANSGNSA
jgi:hypothetical protein